MPPNAPDLPLIQQLMVGASVLAVKRLSITRHLGSSDTLPPPQVYCPSPPVSSLGGGGFDPIKTPIKVSILVPSLEKHLLEFTFSPLAGDWSLC